LTFALVVLPQLVTQPPGLCPHHGIDPWIVRFVLAKHLNANEVFLQLISMSARCLLDNESQEPGELRGLKEGLARENLLEMAVDDFRRNYGWRPAVPLLSGVLCRSV
jgi:hypothetical protein